MKKATGQREELGWDRWCVLFPWLHASACPAWPGKNELGTEQAVPVTTRDKGWAVQTLMAANWACLVEHRFRLGLQPVPGAPGK